MWNTVLMGLALALILVGGVLIGYIVGHARGADEVQETYESVFSSDREEK